MGSFLRFFRYMKGAGRAQRGRKLVAQGRIAEGRALLVAGLELLGADDPHDGNIGVWFSERIAALRDLSTVAANAGDVEEATKRIEEGIALWKNMGLDASKYPHMQEWLAWADAYLRHVKESPRWDRYVCTAWTHPT